MFYIVSLFLLLSYPSSTEAFVVDTACEVDVKVMRFRGETGTTPFTGRERLPFTRPLDEGMPPLTPYEEAPRPSLEFEEPEAIERMKEQEKRVEEERRRDFLLNIPPAE